MGMGRIEYAQRAGVITETNEVVTEKKVEFDRKAYDKAYYAANRERVLERVKLQQKNAVCTKCVCTCNK